MNFALLVDGKCNAACRIIGNAVAVNASQCDACTKLEPYRARGVNHVVVFLAANEMRRRHGRLAFDSLIDRWDSTLNPPQGVGTELEKLIAKWLGVPRSTVSLASGGKSRLKSIEVSGDTDELIGLLEESLAE